MNAVKFVKINRNVPWLIIIPVIKFGLLIQGPIVGYGVLMLYHVIGVTMPCWKNILEQP